MKIQCQQSLSLRRPVRWTAGILALLAPFSAVAQFGPVLGPPAPPSALSPALAPASAAQIQFESLTHNFGEVAAGEVIRHEFKFKNTGSGVLQITAVQPACGCTTASDFKKELNPGESGAIPVQLDTARFTGPIHKTISVTSNSGQNPVTVLQLNGTIWRPLEVIPPYAMFNVITSRDTEAVKTVRIVNNDKEPLKLEKPVVSTKTFQASLEEVVPGKEFNLHVKTVPPLEFGSNQGIITIATSSSKVPTLSVTAYATLQKPVLVSPNQILLPDPKRATTPQQAAGSSLKRSVMVRLTREGETMTVQEPAIDIPGVEVVREELQPGRMFRFNLTFPENLSLPEGRVPMFRAKTSHPDLPLIEVPVAFAVQPRVSATPLSVRPARAPVAPLVAPRPVAPQK